MLDIETMNKVPSKGNKFIYRYFDNEGSYIGQTKKSLKARAGKNGNSYLTSDNKWSRAIIEKGFNHFNVEILCECLENEADKKEKEFIKQYDSRKNGYNTTPGGTCYYENIGGYNKPNYIEVINIKQEVLQMSNENIKYLCKLINKLYKIPFKDFSVNSLIYALKKCDMMMSSASYYLEEGDYYTIFCSGLEFLHEFLEYPFHNCKDVLKSIYFKKHYPEYTCFFGKDCLKMQSIKNNIMNNISDQILDEFIEKELTMLDIDNSVFKIVAGGDCLVLGIKIKYVFEDGD